jgi:hypothetical protein
MREEATNLAKMISGIQQKLREGLYEELQGAEEDLKGLSEPGGYSMALDEYRGKYLDKLYLLQSLVNELANLDETHRRRLPRVFSVAAPTHEELTKLVNKRLTELEGCAVMDIKFLTAEDKTWVAFITFFPSPFPRKRPMPSPQA